MNARRLSRDVATSDAELMARLGRGDLSALGDAYDRYADDVRAFVLRTSGKLDVADDVTQDVFVALVDAAKRFEAGCSLRSFLIGIAGKLILRRRRRSAIALRVLGDLRNWLAPVDRRTPEDGADAMETLDRYKRALAQLSDAKRVTVVMADVEGLRGPEIAAALDIPVRTVWTRLHHARAELRHALDMEDRP